MVSNTGIWSAPYSFKKDRAYLTRRYLGIHLALTQMIIENSVNSWRIFAIFLTRKRRLLSTSSFVKLHVAKVVKATVQEFEWEVRSILQILHQQLLMRILKIDPITSMITN